MSTEVGSVHVSLEAATKGFQAGMARASAQIKTFAHGVAQDFRANKVSLDDAAASAGALTRKLAIVGAAIGAAGTFAVKSASDYEQSRVSFDTMLGSAEKGRAIMKKLSDFARKTPFDLPQVVDGAKRLLAYNISAEKLIPTFEALGNIAAGVGKDKLPNLVLAFGQVKAAGRLTGMELRQFTETGVPLLDVLAKQFGVTTAEVKKMVEEGKIGFPAVEKAIFSMSGEGGKFENLMIRQSKTLSGVFSNLKDGIGRVARDVIGISETGVIREGSIFARLRKAAQELLTWLDSNSPAITKHLQNIIDVATSPVAVAGGGGLLASLGLISLTNFLKGVAKDVMKVGKFWIQTFGGIASAVGKVIPGLQKALTFALKFGKGHPILFAIAVVVGLIAANWDRVAPILEKVWNALKPVVDFFVKLGGIAFEAFVNTLTEIGRVVGDILAPVFKAFTDALTDLWNAVAPTLIPALQSLWNMLTSLWNTIVSALKPAWDALVAAIQPLLPILEKVAMVIGIALAVAVAIFVAVILAIIVVIVVVVTIIVKVITFLLQVWNAIWNAIVAVVKFVWNIISTVVRTGVNIVKAVVTGVIRGVQAVWSAIWNAIVAVVRAVINRVIAIVNTIRRIVSVVAGAIGGVKNAIVNGFNAALNWVRGLIGRFLSVGRDIIRGIVNGIAGAAGAVKDKIIEIAKGALDAVKKFFGIGSPSKLMAEQGRWIGIGLAEGIASTEGLVRGAINGLVDAPALGDGTVGVSGSPAGGNQTFNIPVTGLGQKLTEREIDMLIERMKFKLARELRGAGR